MIHDGHTPDLTVALLPPFMFESHKSLTSLNMMVKEQYLLRRVLFQVVPSPQKIDKQTFYPTEPPDSIEFQSGCSPASFSMLRNLCIKQ